jgi:hypothetical protein
VRGEVKCVIRSAVRRQGDKIRSPHSFLLIFSASETRPPVAADGQTTTKESRRESEAAFSFGPS